MRLASKRRLLLLFRIEFKRGTVAIIDPPFGILTTMKTLKMTFYALVLSLSAIVLSGCDSKWEKIPDHALAEKQAECLAIDDPAAAMIQVCKNYQRECERRRENGIYAC